MIAERGDATAAAKLHQIADHLEDDLEIDMALCIGAVVVWIGRGDDLHTLAGKELRFSLLSLVKSKIEDLHEFDDVSGVEKIGQHFVALGGRMLRAVSRYKRDRK